MNPEELLAKLGTGSNKVFDAEQKIFPTAQEGLDKIVAQVSSKDSEAKNSFEAINTRLNTSVNDILKKF
jgi:hypothetical protein